MKTNIALMYNMGNSGGSWIERFVNTHPAIRIIEEPRRLTGLPKPHDRAAVDEVERAVHGLLMGMYYSEFYLCVGLIKGFRKQVLKWAEERDARIVQQFRHPIRVLHGTRKRPAQPLAYLNRLNEQGRTYFEHTWGENLYEAAHVYWMEYRYRAFWKRESQWPVYKLEDLSASLAGDHSYILEMLRYWTRVNWQEKDIYRAIEAARPRQRQRAKPHELWTENYEDHPDLPWNQRFDPPKEEIWEHWPGWKRQLFKVRFADILDHFGYDRSWL